MVTGDDVDTNTKQLVYDSTNKLSSQPELSKRGKYVCQFVLTVIRCESELTLHLASAAHNEFFLIQHMK